MEVSDDVDVSFDVEGSVKLSLFDVVLSVVPVSSPVVPLFVLSSPVVPLFVLSSPVFSLSPNVSS